ncbi:MAG: sensor histidine kinase [Solimonas sp.]
MTAAATAPAPSAFRGLFAPLNLVAYGVWGALAWSAMREIEADHYAFDARAAVGAAAALALLLLLLTRELHTLRGTARVRAQQWLIVAQIPCALLAFWGLRGGSQAVLLVLVAAQLGVVFRPLWVAAWLLLANAGLGVLLMAGNDSGGDVWISMFAAAGFQAFAALSASYARAAERARDAALQAQAELQAAHALLAEGARGDERLRLSRELHDVVGHKLTALKLQMALAERRKPGDETLRLCRQLADELLREVRGVVGELRRHEGVELQQAIVALAVPFAAAGPRIDLQLDEAVRVADIARAQALLRCAQEGLTNALRHSGAAHIRISLQGIDGATVLGIDDDGAGLRGAPPGFGLTGMRERLAALGGTLEIGDGADGGVRLRAAVPQA